ncbi:NADPH-dependent FMN reductase [Pseudooceanicola sp. C21-150M6]|uniref:NADPH-dependent FMN reductase n=1 Tax=Pseudooceanicola sp. C21-150M6 TaxID=3434355 RepID=UPI003D7F4D52
MTNRLRIAVIVGSTRPGRNAAAVAEWILNIASARDDVVFERLDLQDHPLPILDEAMSAKASALMGLEYDGAHTAAWAGVIAGYDGFVFVTPEYNRAIPAVLKNALDYLFAEWGNKAAAIVAYGAQGGARASAQLRQSLGELHVATVATEVNLMLYSDFENFKTFRPAPVHEPVATLMLDQLVGWAGALQPLRAA